MSKLLPAGVCAQPGSARQPTGPLLSLGQVQGRRCGERPARVSNRTGLTVDQRRRITYSAAVSCAMTPITPLTVMANITVGSDTCQVPETTRIVAIADAKPPAAKSADFATVGR